VISTDIGAPPETVLAPPRVAEEERTGWLVQPGDAPALASALAQALSLAPAARRALGERARRYVLEAFSGAAMQRQTLEVYDGLLGTGLARRFANGQN
jgi:glycosyltransferase involved in cell wall biosynthesis